MNYCICKQSCVDTNICIIFLYVGSQLLVITLLFVFAYMFVVIPFQKTRTLRVRQSLSIYLTGPSPIAHPHIENTTSLKIINYT